MRVNSIINRYILCEMIPPFFINMLFITFIFLMATILKITKLIVNYRVSLWKVILFIAYSIPMRLEFIIPMSIMMAILLTFLRMSSDNEIVALKTSGVSIYGLLPPVVLFCLIGGLMTAWMAIFGATWGRLAFKSLALEVAQSHLDVGLKERTFNDTFEGVMLYVNKIDLKNNRLIDVFIEDRREAQVVSMVVAPEGRLLKEPGNEAYHLHLFNGSINQVDLNRRSAHALRFDSYDIRLDIKKVLSSARSGPKAIKEMNIGELRRYIRKGPEKEDQYFMALMELHRKFSLPASCLVLGLLAVPLGIQSRSSKRTYGIGLGLVFFLLYYLLLSAGRVFGKSGIYPPMIGMWVPNLVMAAIGVFLLVQTARERSLPIENWFYWIKRTAAKFRIPLR